MAPKKTKAELEAARARRAENRRKLLEVAQKAESDLERRKRAEG